MENEQKKKNNYRELWPEKEYLKNLIAAVISRFGDSIDAIAFSWLVYELTESASLTALTFGVNKLVTVFLQPFSAALVTRMNKKAIIVSTAAGRGLLAIAVALLYAQGFAQPWMLILSTAMMSTLEAFGQPAGMAIYPKIIAKEKYTLAMSLSGAVTNVAEIAGMALAGVVIALMGVSAALLIDAGAFLVSALILATLRLPRHVRERAGNAFRVFVSDTRDGFRYVLNHKLTLAICISAVGLNFALVPYASLQAPFVNESLGLGAQAMSAMGVALTVGMALGALIFPKLAARFSRFTLLFAGVILMSVCYMALSSVALVPGDTAKWMLLVSVLLPMGMALSFANTSVQVSVMEKTEEAFLARVNGIMNSICMAAIPVASFIIAAIAKSVDVTVLIFGCGVFSVLISLSFLLMKPLKEL